MGTWDGYLKACKNDLPDLTAFNEWCTNCPRWDTCYTNWGNPIDKPVSYTVGLGASGGGNRFSANSDKWISSDIGVGIFARYQSCSGNQILINYIDKKTINVSRNPRSCLDSSYNRNCSFAVNGRWTYNEAGDFFVTAPREDILPELQRYVEISAGRERPQQQRRYELTACSEGSIGWGRYRGELHAYDLRGRRVSGLRARAGAGVLLIDVFDGKQSASATSAIVR
jgi:hypothetical protein